MGINRATDNYDRQVAELHPGIYLDRWLVYLTELGILADNLSWTKAALDVELQDSLKKLLPKNVFYYYQN